MAESYYRSGGCKPQASTDLGCRNIALVRHLSETRFFRKLELHTIPAAGRGVSYFSQKCVGSFDSHGVCGIVDEASYV